MAPTPEAILGLTRSFMESRILLTGAEMDLFTLLSASPLSAGEIAERTGADLRALTILLDALTGMEFLAKKEGKYECPAPIAAHLSAESPASVLPMVRHFAHLWPRWSQLTRRVQGSPPPEGPSLFARAEELQAFIGAMHVIAGPLAPRIVAAVRPGTARALLDVGGASGTYTLAFLQAAAQMQATVFDRPDVVGMARRRFQEAGLLDRVKLVGGDFYRDELPGGHDLAFLSAIIHQNSPQQNLELFAKVFRALVPGGRIVIRDHVMGSDRTQPQDGAVFAVNMLLVTDGGNSYTFDDIENGLAGAGFIRVKLLQQGEHMNGLVEAYKP